jgi:hypothetical protein
MILYSFCLFLIYPTTGLTLKDYPQTQEEGRIPQKQGLRETKPGFIIENTALKTSQTPACSDKFLLVPVQSTFSARVLR